jgi:hypothetical protein
MLGGATIRQSICQSMVEVQPATPATPKRDPKARPPKRDPKQRPPKRDPKARPQRKKGRGHAPTWF